MKGIPSLEYGFDDSRQDRKGTDPFIPNSFHKVLAGYQHPGWSDFSYTLQFYGERMQDYNAYKSTLPPGAPRADEFRALLTLRATQLLKYQTWKLSLFAFYSPTDNDYYTIPEAQYKFTDKLAWTVGGNIFGGESQTTFFGQYEKTTTSIPSCATSFKRFPRSQLPSAGRRRMLPAASPSNDGKFPL